MRNAVEESSLSSGLSGLYMTPTFLPFRGVRRAVSEPLCCSPFASTKRYRTVVVVVPLSARFVFTLETVPETCVQVRRRLTMRVVTTAPATAGITMKSNPTGTSTRPEISIITVPSRLFAQLTSSRILLGQGGEGGAGFGEQAGVDGYVVGQAALDEPTRLGGRGDGDSLGVVLQQRSPWVGAAGKSWPLVFSVPRPIRTYNRPFWRDRMQRTPGGWMPPASTTPAATTLVHWSQRYHCGRTTAAETAPPAASATPTCCAGPPHAAVVWPGQAHPTRTPAGHPHAPRLSQHHAGADRNTARSCRTRTHHAVR